MPTLEDYGANSIAPDNTAAIQRAFDDCAAKASPLSVQLWYPYTGQLRLPEGLVVTGNGAGGFVNPNGGGMGMLANGLQNLTFDGVGWKGRGIDVRATKNLRITNFTFADINAGGANHDSNGIYLNATSGYVGWGSCTNILGGYAAIGGDNIRGMKVEGIHFKNCLEPLHYFANTGNTELAGNVIRQCYFEGTGRAEMELQDWDTGRNSNPNAPFVYRDFLIEDCYSELHNTAPSDFRFGFSIPMQFSTGTIVRRMYGSDRAVAGLEMMGENYSVSDSVFTGDGSQCSVEGNGRNVNGKWNNVVLKGGMFWGDGILLPGNAIVTKTNITIIKDQTEFAKHIPARPVTGPFQGAAQPPIVITGPTMALTVDKSDPGSLLLTFSPSPAKVERKATNGGGAFVVIANSAASPFKDTGLMPNWKYDYRVTGADGSSATGTQQVIIDQPVPPAPTPTPIPPAGIDPAAAKPILAELKASFTNLSAAPIANLPTALTSMGKAINDFASLVGN